MSQVEDGERPARSPRGGRPRLRVAGELRERGRLRGQPQQTLQGKPHLRKNSNFILKSNRISTVACVLNHVILE